MELNDQSAESKRHAIELAHLRQAYEQMERDFAQREKKLQSETDRVVQTETGIVLIFSGWAYCFWEQQNSGGGTNEEARYCNF